MNTHHKHLKKLGRDVEELEKKITKFKQVKGDTKTTSCQGEKKVITSCQDIVVKNKPTLNFSKPVAKKRSNSKDQRISSVEVSVKTKGPEKPNKRASTHSTVLTLPLSPKKTQSEPHQSRECHCSTADSKISKTVIWSNILKESPCSGSQPIVSKEVENGKSVHKARSKNLVNERENESEELASEDSDAEIDSVEASIEACLNGKIWHHKEENHYKANSQGDKGSKSNVDKCLNSADLSDSKSGMPAKNVETLQLLVKKLHKKFIGDEDNNTRKLIDEIEQVLGRMPKATPSASEVSCKSKVSSRKSSARQSLNTDNSLKGNLASEAKVDRISEQPMSYTVNEKLIESQELNNCKMPNGVTSKASGDYLEVNRCYSTMMPKRAFSLGEKSDFPLRIMNDKDTQINLSFEREEKVKEELDFLKKQLNLQLRSADSMNTKESEYHSLFTTLADKVKQLEDHVNEQTKAAQKFYLQSNMLLGQSNIIPVLQTSQELLNKRLLDTIHNYEKLKTDYSLLKLEKEKYCALNDEKDKQMKKFKDELTNIQHLVGQQMEVVKNFVGFSSASDNVDTLLNIIDSQSNIIKSRLGGIQLEDGTTSPPITSPASMSPSSYSPISTAREPGLNFQSGALEGQSENNSKGFPADLYLLKVPELQSPNLS